MGTETAEKDLYTIDMQMTTLPTVGNIHVGIHPPRRHADRRVGTRTRASRIRVREVIPA